MGSVRVPAPAGPSLLSASTRSRDERRQRLSAWGRGAVKRLRHLGLDVSGCDVDDGGLLFVPDGRLALTLDAGAVEVALVLPPSELPALRTILGGSQRPQTLTTALSALPEQFAIGASSDATRIPAPRASADDLHGLLDRAERQGGAVWLGWRVPRELAAAHAATLDAQLQDALVALGQVLQLFARQTAAEPGKAKRARRHAGGQVEGEHDRGKPRARTRARERDREPEAERDDRARVGGRRRLPGPARAAAARGQTQAARELAPSPASPGPARASRRARRCACSRARSPARRGWCRTSTATGARASC